jgi:hypothetical protein
MIMKHKALFIVGLSLVMFAVGLRGQDDQPEGGAENTEVQPAPEEEKIVLTADEQKAVDGYKAQMLEIKTWLLDYIDSAHENEARAYRTPVLVSEKLAGVKTEGLPAVITEPLAAYRKTVDEQALLLKDMPKDDAEAMEWMAKKLGDEKWAAEVDNLQAEQSERLSHLAYAAERCGAGKESDIFNITELSQFMDRWVVILGAFKDFDAAKADAVRVAEATKTTFTLRGMIHDEKGLRMPDDFEDEIYAGQYVLRAGNMWFEGEKEFENHISVEDSSGYEGFEPGFFISVGFIAESAEEAEKKVEEFKKHSPGTYAKQTVIFMGCDR